MCASLSLSLSLYVWHCLCNHVVTVLKYSSRAPQFRSVAFMSVRPGSMRRTAGPAVRSSSSELDAWLATLHAQAALACDERVQVHYLGQQCRRADRALYRVHPQDWKLQPGVGRYRVVVCFSWQPRIPQAVPASMTQAGPAITKQRNDHARTRPLVRPPALAQRSVPKS